MVFGRFVVLSLLFFTFSLKNSRRLLHCFQKVFIIRSGKIWGFWGGFTLFSFFFFKLLFFNRTTTSSVLKFGLVNFPCAFLSVWVWFFISTIISFWHGIYILFVCFCGLIYKVVELFQLVFSAVITLYINQTVQILPTSIMDHPCIPKQNIKFPCYVNLNHIPNKQNNMMIPIRTKRCEFIHLSICITNCC